MYFATSLAVLTALAATAAAAPAAAVPDTPRIMPRADAMCGYQFHPTFPYVGVYMPNNLMPSAQGTGSWGGGFIDNLRGKETAAVDQCNPIGWQAVLDDSGTGLAAVFNVEVGCSGTDIARALHAASGVWVICADDIGADVDSLVSIGASVASVLIPFVAGGE